MTPRLAVTLGDPRGIGPEIVARALEGFTAAEVVLVGPDDLVAGLPATRRAGVGRWGRGPGDDGDPARALLAGRLTGFSVERAVALALAGEVDGIVTAPAEKRALHRAGFPWPGHTEWLAHLAGDVDVAMMLAAGALRVVLLTTHVALRDVPALVTADLIHRVAAVTRRGLVEWFGLEAPRLALCALNPHGGEGGLFGDEEQRVLAPAARVEGLLGPWPADTAFVRALRGEADAVLVPVHDVGMTAIKVAAFGAGVNVTLGLPFPRTSPDHGTAFDIAGTGRADPSSMREALATAARLAARAATRRGAASARGAAPA